MGSPAAGTAKEEGTGLAAWLEIAAANRLVAGMAENEEPQQLQKRTCKTKTRLIRLYFEEHDCRKIDELMVGCLCF